MLYQKFCRLYMYIHVVSTCIFFMSHLLTEKPCLHFHTVNCIKLATPLLSTFLPHCTYFPQKSTNLTNWVTVPLWCTYTQVFELPIQVLSCVRKFCLWCTSAMSSLCQLTYMYIQVHPETFRCSVRIADVLCILDLSYLGVHGPAVS